MKAWHLETGESLYEVGPPGQSAMLGALSGSVCVLSDRDLLTFYKASTGLESMQTRLSSPTHTHSPTDTLSPTHTRSKAHTLRFTCTLYLPRNDMLLLASKGGFIFQVVWL